MGGTAAVCQFCASFSQPFFFPLWGNCGETNHIPSTIPLDPRRSDRQMFRCKLRVTIHYHARLPPAYYKPLPESPEPSLEPTISRQ